jgi:hypothetical protein
MISTKAIGHYSTRKKFANHYRYITAGSERLRKYRIKDSYSVHLAIDP